MSLVSIVATQDFISVITDGRISGGTEVERSEEYRKVQSLTEPKFFVAYVGAKDKAESLASLAISLANKDMSIREIAKVVQERSIGFRGMELEKHSGRSVELMIGGYEDGLAQFYVVSNKPDFLSFLPTEDNPCFYANEVQGQLGTKKILETYLELGQSPITFEKADFAQRKLLEYVSKRESSVNNVANPLVMTNDK